jgi:hypothetical protein
MMFDRSGLKYDGLSGRRLLSLNLVLCQIFILGLSPNTSLRRKRRGPWHFLRSRFRLVSLVQPQLLVLTAHEVFPGFSDASISEKESARDKHGRRLSPPPVSPDKAWRQAVGS